MKDAGFTCVRMGHLAWDSYEPSEGKFDFGWFDKVMDLMNDAGIKVILDIAIRPAPIWLHHKYPSIDVVDVNGDRHYPNHRYMEDVGDPMYQKYAVRYADTLTKHYAKFPALMAFGIDNESGDGPISYSETVRKKIHRMVEEKNMQQLTISIKHGPHSGGQEGLTSLMKSGFPSQHITMTFPSECLISGGLFLMKSTKYFLRSLIK